MTEQASESTAEEAGAETTTGITAVFFGAPQAETTEAPPVPVTPTTAVGPLAWLQGHSAAKLASREQPDANVSGHLQYSPGVPTETDKTGDGESTSVIPRQVTFKGAARFHGDVRLEGRFEGEMTVEGGGVEIAVDAEHTGDVVARSIRVEGKIDGKVDVGSGLASFGPNSTCTGSIHYGRIAIEEGAAIEAMMKRAVPAI